MNEPNLLVTTNRAHENQPVTEAAVQLMEGTVALHMAGILDALGIDRTDPNVVDTPKRYAKMLCREVCSGRFTEPPDLTVFPNDGSPHNSSIQMTGPLPVRSLCSHHFCPVLGRCWVAYLPGAQLVGLSKFARVVDWFACRPQMQELMVEQIADFFETTVQPRGIAIWLEAQHTCMTWRGVRVHADAAMVTSSLRGVFREDAAARNEFLHFVGR